MTRRLEVVSVSDVEIKEVQWLVPPYIPLGKVTLLEGDPESGKTFLAIEFAAAITAGRTIEPEVPIEGQAPLIRTTANVLYFTGEDDVADTLKPRFIKQKGDPSRFFSVQGMIAERDGKDIRETFTLSCVEELEQALILYRPQLVVIDPLQAFLGARVDMHRANEVRPVMTGLKEVAERNGCAILVVRHLNKSTNQRSGYRGMGSIDFTAAARSVLLAGKHPHGGNRFVLVHHKSSNCPKGPSLTYAIGGDGLSWMGTADISADDLLGTTRQTAKPRDVAAVFLREILAGGPISSVEVQKAADLKGISPRDLQRAKKSLGVVGRPLGFQQPWCLELPALDGSLPASSLSTTSNHQMV